MIPSKMIAGALLGISVFWLVACGDQANTITEVKTPGDAVPTTDAEPEGPLTEDNYDAYRARIQPEDGIESAWLQIDWQPSYAVGLRVASEQQKPILLWVMNGHPLGCT